MFTRRLIQQSKIPDTYVDPNEISVSGGIDTHSLDRVADQAWGETALRANDHGDTCWRQFVAALCAGGHCRGDLPLGCVISRLNGGGTRCR